MQEVIPLFSVVFVILAISTPFYFLSLNKIIKLLKNNYPLKYEELGKPSLFLNNSIQNGMNLVKFIFSADDLNDPALAKYKLISKILLTVNLLIFVPCFVYINLRIAFRF